MYIIFLHNGKLAVTSIDNYRARMMNVDIIIDFSEFNSIKSVIDYIKKYSSKISEWDIVIKDDVLEVYKYEW